MSALYYYYYYYCELIDLRCFFNITIYLFLLSYTDLVFFLLLSYIILFILIFAVQMGTNASTGRTA